VQIVIAAVVAAMVVWIWRQKIQFELKAAALGNRDSRWLSPYIIYYGPRGARPCRLHGFALEGSPLRISSV